MASGNNVHEWGVGTITQNAFPSVTIAYVARPSLCQCYSVTPPKNSRGRSYLDLASRMAQLRPATHSRTPLRDVAVAVASSAAILPYGFAQSSQGKGGVMQTSEWAGTTTWCRGVSCICVVALSCCNVGEAPDMPRVLVSDSAGVPRVEVSALRRLQARKWTVEESFRVSEAGVTLFGVTAARLLRGGHLAVANAGNQEVLLIGEDGHLLRTVGTDGDGPGEFRSITSLHESHGGFLAYDARLGRLTSFDSSGGFIDSRPLEPPNRVVDLLPLTMDAEGRGLVVYGSQRIGRAEGIRQDTTPLLRYTGANALPDTIGLWGGEENSYTRRANGGWSSTPVGFGRHLAASGRLGRLVLGTTDSLNATVLDSAGTVILRLIGRYRGAAVATNDGLAWQSDLAESTPADLPKRIKEMLREAPFHDSYPAFDALLLATDGDVWVGSATQWTETQREWFVFSPSGDLIGAVAMPKDAELLDVAYGRLVARTRDRQGVEDVVAYRLNAER